MMCVSVSGLSCALLSNTSLNATVNLKFSRLLFSFGPSGSVKNDLFITTFSTPSLYFDSTVMFAICGQRVGKKATRKQIQNGRQKSFVRQRIK